MSTAPKRKYDSTVARIAGNILSNWRWVEPETGEPRLTAIASAVAAARAIVAECERTEPKPACTCPPSPDPHLETCPVAQWEASR